MAHRNEGNKHAAKPEEEKATAHLHGRVMPAHKSRWVKQAQKEGMKLMPWVVKTLNDACDK